jgi:hypothetical protein
MRLKTTRSVKVADQVWVIAALLHREQPAREDFAVDEIMARARSEALTRPPRPSFHVHLIQHCVANRRPNPGRWRMLVETRPGRRRLYRPGDPYHAERENSRTVPEATGLPPQYQELLTWYRRVYTQAIAPGSDHDPLLALRGSGQALWADEPADAYVERLREGWR